MRDNALASIRRGDGNAIDLGFLRLRAGILQRHPYAGVPGQMAVAELTVAILENELAAAGLTGGEQPSVGIVALAEPELLQFVDALRDGLLEWAGRLELDRSRAALRAAARLEEVRDILQATPCA